MSKCPCGNCHCYICGNQMDSLTLLQQELAAEKEKSARLIFHIGNLLEEVGCSCGYYDAVDKEGNSVWQECSKCWLEENAKHST